MFLSRSIISVCVVACASVSFAQAVAEEEKPKKLPTLALGDLRPLKDKEAEALAGRRVFGSVTLKKIAPDEDGDFTITAESFSRGTEPEPGKPGKPNAYYTILYTVDEDTALSLRPDTKWTVTGDVEKGALTRKRRGPNDAVLLELKLTNVKATPRI